MQYSIIFSLFASLAMVAATPTPFTSSDISSYFANFAFSQAFVELNGEKIKGRITLTQLSERAPILITWDVQGLDPGAKRGFHVHESGNLTNGNCTLAGGHYNPFGKEHGGPQDEERHVGDLGNIDVDANGVSRGIMIDPLVKLTGPQAVMGRSIVIHAGQDDLGKGATPDSKKTGNAGARPACGVIQQSAGGLSLKKRQLSWRP